MFSSDDFPNRFDFREAQERIYKLWEEKGCFHAAPDPSKKPFSIVIPPPNVTGALHLGHALNNSLQDFVVRFKRMQGFNTLWMPGTDHAGIATQAVVEKRLKELEGKTRHDLGRTALVQRIWKWKEEYEARILGQLKRMGASCDWERTRFTLDPICAKAVRTTFFDLFRKNLLYRGKKLVNWDTFLQTTVSDDEVNHETVKGHFWHFRYPVIDPKPNEPKHVIVATTRPETMLGDTAVAVHPNPKKAFDDLEAELRLRREKAPAKDQPGIDQQLANIEYRRRNMLPQLELLRDMALAGRRVMLPLLEREIPIVADEWAKPELGSGCVKITPAHDGNDYDVGRRQSLPMINILNTDGTLNNNASQYKGLTIPQARQRVVADLDALGLVDQIEDREIELAHSDRSKTPIEPFLANQWFVRMNELAQSAIDAVVDGRVAIIPPRYAKSYIDWLAEKRDWPVSRQLWWGHQIPIWSKLCQTKEQHDQEQKLLLADADLKSGALSMQVELDEERAAAERNDNLVQGAENVDLPYCTIHLCFDEENKEISKKWESRGYKREEDVLDTWFSSALWPHSTLGWPEQTEELKYYYPTSLLITSRDIITLWVARMVLTGLNNCGDVPFRQVFIHPKVLDGYGDTMSKSKGNGVDPLDVIEKFGADALRYGMANLATETQDVRMPVQFECPHCQTLIDQTRKNRILPVVACTSCGKGFSTMWAENPEDKALPRGAVVSERFEVARNFCNKLWNASRFALLNLEGYTAAPVTDDQLGVEDRWILSRLNHVTKDVTAAMNEYRFAEASRQLYDFAWDEFCSFYVEIAKGRLQDPATRPIAQRVMVHSLDVLLRLLHPMMPFITEELWRLFNLAAPERGLRKPETAPELLITAPWPAAEEKLLDSTIETRFARFQQVLGAVNEIRNRQNIAMKIAIEFTIRCDPHTAELLLPMAANFKKMTNAGLTDAGAHVTAPATNATSSLPGLEIFVDMRDLIDEEAEKVRLQKEEQKLLEHIRAKEGKLSNESFTSRAPAEVVAKERESLRQLKEQLSAIQLALEELRKRKK
jgi:valyl-tRNA synthetase